mmetsp:Transcript_24780/g.98375  ORF Transcript_24780/g.98375 Transcript_24780/m.98375 type:complete len:202 (-) Transcript_24780:951-1556(-)
MAPFSRDKRSRRAAARQRVARRPRPGALLRTLLALPRQSRGGLGDGATVVCLGVRRFDDRSRRRLVHVEAVVVVVRAVAEGHHAPHDPGALSVERAGRRGARRPHAGLPRWTGRARRRLDLGGARRGPLPPRRAPRGDRRDHRPLREHLGRKKNYRRGSSVVRCGGLYSSSTSTIHATCGRRRPPDLSSMKWNRRTIDKHT